MLLDEFGCDTDDMLTLPVLHHVQRLQRADDVALCDARHLTVGVNVFTLVFNMRLTSCLSLTIAHDHLFKMNSFFEL